MKICRHTDAAHVNEEPYCDSYMNTISSEWENTDHVNNGKRKFVCLLKNVGKCFILLFLIPFAYRKFRAKISQIQMSLTSQCNVVRLSQVSSFLFYDSQVCFSQCHVHEVTFIYINMSLESLSPIFPDVLLKILKQTASVMYACISLWKFLLL